MTIRTYTDEMSGQDILYDDSIGTSTEYQNGQNNGTSIFNTSTGQTISTPTDGNSLGSLLTNLFTGKSSTGTIGQIAGIAGLGALLNGLLGSGSGAGGYAGYQGGIPQFTANRQQYATPQVQTGVYAPNLPANATPNPNAITKDQLTSYLKSGNLNDTQIANQMNRYGITPGNLSGITGIDQAAIQQRYNQTMGPNAQLGAYRPGQGGITYFSPMKYYTQPPAVTPTPEPTPVVDSTVKAAGGGMMGISSLGGYSDGGRLLRGPGDGVSDSIPASIGDRQPARLADGEFVVPARIVSELGNGSTEAGARKLYEMMDRVKHARSKAKNIAADTKASKYLPA
jgi:hypothetical protein